MQLTTKARYAVMAMVDIALCHREYGFEKAVTLSDIAKRQNITVPYLEQIFSKLKRAGLVSSVRGPGGGYVLAKDSSVITATDIIDAVEETIKIKGCSNHSDGRSCVSNKAKCLTHDLWDGLGGAIRAYLSSATLEDIIERNINIENANLAEFKVAK